MPRPTLSTVVAKIFNASWDIDGEAQEKSLFAMIRNTYQMNSEGASTYKDNAAVITGWKGGRFPNPGEMSGYTEEDIHILMKVETHNHPTAIAPWPGASTGSGGEVVMKVPPVVASPRRV